MAPRSKHKASKTQPFGPTTNTSVKSRADATETPNWPALSGLLNPTRDLNLTTLLPDQILLIPNLFTPTLCRTYTSFLSTLPLVTTAKPKRRDEAVRVNDRFQIHDPTFAHVLWTQTGLRELLTQVEESRIWGDGGLLGLNPNIRVYRYRPSQFFDKHYDESNKLDLGADPPVAAKTTWTLLIYLSRCEGGETVFYPDGPAKGPRPDPVVVEVEPGLALLHRHGDRCLLHEGREVRSGEKWVLRSDLVVER